MPNFKEIKKLIWFKEWNTLTGAQQLSLGLSLGGGIISIAKFLLSGATPGFYYSLVAAITIPIFVDRLNRYVFENKTTKELARHMDSKFDLKYVGKTQSGIDLMCSSLPGATSVRNTALRQPYGPAAYNEAWEYTQKAVAAEKRSLSGGCRWKELYFVSSSEEYDESIVDRLFIELDEKQKSNYRHAILKHALPFFQMVIISYEEDDTKPPIVIFGWNYDGVGDPMVFQSSEPTTVGYFTCYYDALYQKAEGPNSGNSPTLPTPLRAPSTASPSPPV